VRYIIVILQFRVAVATNCGTLASSMNMGYALRHEQAHAYFMSSNIIFTWMREVEYTIEMRKFFIDYL
jgi:hypothetical protein